jgi:hypothetical protein
MVPAIPINHIDPSGNSWLSSAFHKIGRDIRGIVHTAEAFVHNPVNFLEHMAEDPMTWVTVASWAFGVPLPFAGLSWGPFSYGIGITGGGMHFGFSWTAAAGEAASGSGFGPATFGIRAPLVSGLERPLFANPVQSAQPGAAGPAI